jgi:hypothetical protein
MPFALTIAFALTIPLFDATDIRVRNDSALALTKVFIGRTNYGDIKSHGVTEYKPWDKAYSYATVELFADAKPLLAVAIDYFGETPLGEGKFTYVIQIVDGRISLKCEKDSQ